MGVHKALKMLREKMDLQHFCGYITMLNPFSHPVKRKLSDASEEKGWFWVVKLVRLFVCFF